MGQKERIPLLSAAQKDPVHISASVWMKGSKVLCGVPGPRRTAVQTTTECVLSNAVMIGRGASSEPSSQRSWHRY